MKKADIRIMLDSIDDRFIAEADLLYGTAPQAEKQKNLRSDDDEFPEDTDLLYSAPQSSRRRKNMLRIAAAAACLILCFAGSSIIFHSQDISQSPEEEVHHLILTGTEINIRGKTAFYTEITKYSPDCPDYFNNLESMLGEPADAEINSLQFADGRTDDKVTFYHIKGSTDFLFLIKESFDTNVSYSLWEFKDFIYIHGETLVSEILNNVLNIHGADEISTVTIAAPRINSSAETTSDVTLSDAESFERFYAIMSEMVRHFSDEWLDGIPDAQIEALQSADSEASLKELLAEGEKLKRTITVYFNNGTEHRLHYDALGGYIKSSPYGVILSDEDNLWLKNCAGITE